MILTISRPSLHTWQIPGAQVLPSHGNIMLGYGAET
jgi:hypothetical protein